MQQAAQNDIALWQLVKQNDHAAFAMLFDRYWEEMFEIACRRINDEDQCKDIVQNIFIHTWENRFQIEVDTTLAPYLFTALKYSVVRCIYVAAKKGTTALPLSVFNIPEQEQPFAEDWQQFDGLQQKVNEEVAAMPSRMQQIFILNKKQELTVKEIAIRLSISEQTVKNQLHTAIKRLRIRMRQQAFLLPFIF